MNSPSPPPAPSVGSQLQGSNTPFANISWSQGPNGQWQSTTAPSSLVTNQLNAFASQTPQDVNNAIQQASQLGVNYMSPLWNQQQSQLNSQLANEGFSPTDAAYGNAQRQLQNNENNWLGGNISQFAPIAMQEYQQPLQLAESMLNPQLTNPNAGAVQNATNTTTAAQQYAYGQQLANQNAMMGGLFGLGAAGLGGWGKAGFPGASSLFSGLGNAGSMLGNMITGAGLFGV